MAIEFICPACKQLVRTPDSTGGKKGRCPYCREVMQIPTASTAGGQGTGARGRESGDSRQEAGDRKQESAGKPAASQAASAKPAAQSPQSAIRNPQSAIPAAASATITFNCPSCSAVATAPLATAGKKGRCPICKAVVQIPAAASGGTNKPATEESVSKKSAATTEKAAPAQPKWVKSFPDVPELTPAPYRTDDELLRSPDVLSPAAPLPALLPKSDFGAAPVFNPQPAISPLQPMGGGSPFGPSPFAAPLQPLPQPLAGSPFGPASFGGMPAAFASHDYVDDSQRYGLPWERRQNSEGFFSTIRLVLFGPSKAFAQMHPAGGVAAAVGFCLAGTAVGSAATSLYMLLIHLWRLTDNPFFTEFFQASPLAYIKQWAFLLIVNFLGLSAIPPTFALIAAGIHHLVLLVIARSQRSFATTLKLHYFCSGSLSVLLCLPIIGSLWALVATPICIALGSQHSHNTSSGAAWGSLFVFGFLYIPLAFALWYVYWYVIFNMVIAKLMPLLI